MGKRWIPILGQRTMWSVFSLLPKRLLEGFETFRHRSTVPLLRDDLCLVYFSMVGSISLFVSQ